jgi:uncharacterized membrane protein YgdD (TMEM256/DUF423 family)
MYKQALTAGALLAMVAVILGAFAAHGLKDILPADKIDTFQKGVTYQFYHSFALLVVGIIYAYYPAGLLKTSSIMFILGIVFFSGSLYLYPLLEVKNVNIPVIARLITPLGGLCFIIGWLLLFLGIIKK